MLPLTDVAVPPHSPERFGAVVGTARMHKLVAGAALLRDQLAGRAVWNVNSTASGGGVAEMLPVLVGYANGCGIDTRWTVIEGDDQFFVVTKRIHHWLHGARGDRASLTEGDVAHYEQVLERNGRALAARVHAGDIVILHDPQTAGLVPLVKKSGAKVVWRCHIGSSDSTDRTDDAWSFLRHYLDDADAFVFSRAAYAPGWMPTEKVRIIPPSLDTFSPKNQPLDESDVVSILARIGIIEGAPAKAARYFRRDGTVGEVHRSALIVRNGTPIARDTPLVVQVSRWDPLKDMAGVMEAFARATDGSAAHLALVGPAVDAVDDDPEGARVFADCVARWRALKPEARDRTMLVSLPLDDVDENAAMVNALQRHAAVVVQKSLAEGFGLTVAEAMWKQRAVLASDVGGIPDQIAPGTGVLLADPTDLDTAGAEMMRLIADAELRRTIGEAARERVQRHFVGDRHLLQWGALVADLLT